MAGKCNCQCHDANSAYIHGYHQYNLARCVPLASKPHAETHSTESRDSFKHDIFKVKAHRLKNKYEKSSNKRDHHCKSKDIRCFDETVRIYMLMKNNNIFFASYPGIK